MAAPGLALSQPAIILNAGFVGHKGTLTFLLHIQDTYRNLYVTFGALASDGLLLSSAPAWCRMWVLISRL